MNKAIDINELIVDKDLDVLCLSETWFRDSGDEVSIGEMTPPGYTLMHSPRTFGRGGGVAVIYRNQVKLSQCKQKSFKTFDYLDICLTAGKQTVRVLVVYRPCPTKSNKLTSREFFEDFPGFVAELSSKVSNILIIGDLNFHMDVPSNAETKRISQVLEPLGFSQMVIEPTHARGHTLDVVWTKTPKLVKDLSVENLMMSDHFLVQLELDMSRSRVPRVTLKRRNIKAINRDQFRDDLANSSLVTDPPDDIEDLVNLYNKVLTELLEKHAPEVSKRVPERPLAPWMNDNILRARQARRRAERKKRSTRLVVDAELYKKARDKVTREIKLAKSRYFQEQLDATSDPKKVFSIIDKLLNKSDRSDTLPDMLEQEAAEAFSNYFSSKIEKIRQGFPDQTNATQPQHSNSQSDVLACFHLLSEEQVLKLLNRANPTTAVVDPIPTQLMLEFVDTLLPVLTKIINTSIESGTVPEAFKRAAVKPLLKKASLDANELGNYRPVSNLPYLSKILERAVVEQLNVHLELGGLQTKFQSAYRTGHSTETALVRIMNDLLSMIDSGHNALLVLLDLSSAFDTIDHDLLLGRLRSDIHLDGRVLDWFRSYLSGRTQEVYVGQSHSACATLKYGVPQGSVLGPLLFSLYTRDLANLIHSFCLDHHFFADDTELYSCLPVDEVSACKAIENVQNCCAAVKQWMATNKLKLNDSKTEVLVCGPPDRRDQVPVVSLTVGDASISFSESAKTLGVYFDATLSLEKHVSHVVKTCFYHIRCLSKIRPYITRKAAASIAVSLVLSRIDYCNSLLFGLPNAQIKRLQAAQNAAARIVTKSRCRDHVTPILKELHWLPVQQRCEHKLLSLVQKCLKGQAPAYLSELLQPYTPSRSLRSASRTLLRVPGPKDIKSKRFGQRTFRYSGPSLYNDLPEQVKDLELASFKSKLKTYLFPK